jgi:hypothetical protein
MMISKKIAIFLPYKQGVTGSNPVVPTPVKKVLSAMKVPFFF